jgi:hypothetical protein
MSALRRAVIALLCAVLAPAAGFAAEALDEGTFRVFQRGRALGAETFVYERGGDSLRVFSSIFQTIPTADGDQVFEKKAMLIANAFDFALARYQSEQKYRQRTLIRGVEAQDTTVTLYREIDGSGEGTSFALPPGRAFVIDAAVFTLFDVICRNLHRQSFTSRPILVVAIGENDSVYEARATDLGTETIRWGKQTVNARKLAIGDDHNSFQVWVSPRGRMLKLEHADSGLRVERDPAPVTPAPKPGG